ncbi:MAG: alpha-glucosidase [Microbacteriaceae bacterium]|nr:MAG: alpha-glucosidase [Microbacteriaceae bacterium]
MTRRDYDTWWRDAVVYQIYPRSFADSDGDGIGDLGGVLERIDHLDHLGVDVVWLSPIYPSPQDDNGYDVSDYRDVDPVFGDLATLDRITEELHRRDMRLVLDLVVNHTSDEHPWFRDSASGRGSARRDWYWWRPPRPGFEGGEPGAEPTNWAGFFSGSTWEFDPASGEYYLHLFSRKQPDLNWENPEVRTAVYETMNWWLDRGVDGFRMDVINLISKDPTLPDAPVKPGARFGDGFPFYACGPRIHEFLHEMHQEVFRGRDEPVLSIGEMPGVTIADAVDFTDPARREVDMVFQFEHMGVDHGPDGKWSGAELDRGHLMSTLVRWQEGLADRGWNSLYWSNHDQPRVVSRFGDPERYWRESATALAAVLHLQRGTPFIYQGEELGMTDMPFGSVDELRDIESLNYVAEALADDPEALPRVMERIRRIGRDNARTPMQWDASHAAGFTSGEPWIAVNPNHRTINAAAQRDDPASVYGFYRELIALRHREPLVVTGAFRALDATLPVVSFAREQDGEALVLRANLSSVPASSPDPGGEVVLANHTDPRRDGTLRPWEVVVTRVARASAA